MSASFFASQKLPTSRSMMTHLEYLLGNIVFIRPADVDYWSQRYKQTSDCSASTDQSTTYPWQSPKLFKNSHGTAFLSMLKRAALASHWHWAAHHGALALKNALIRFLWHRSHRRKQQYRLWRARDLFHPQYLVHIGTPLRPATENWPRKPHTFLCTPCQVWIRPGIDRRADCPGNSQRGLKAWSRPPIAQDCSGVCQPASQRQITLPHSFLWDPFSPLLNDRVCSLADTVSQTVSHSRTGSTANRRIITDGAAGQSDSIRICQTPGMSSEAYCQGTRTLQSCTVWEPISNKEAARKQT